MRVRLDKSRGERRREKKREVGRRGEERRGKGRESGKERR